ncbi:hypothetical protein CMUS01_08943, partial [Colletotrichum musicola]
KFAYSSAFGFSVPTGPLIQQLAPDSTLALSRDGGETWALRWKSEEVRFSKARLVTAASGGVVEEVPVATAKWYPWGDQSVSVETTVVPPTNRWPDWHVRIHRIKPRVRVETLRMVEGGFAILGRKRDGAPLLEFKNVNEETEVVLGETEGVFRIMMSSLVCSSAGASGIVAGSTIGWPCAQRGGVLKPDANTNLACQRTLIPIITRNMPSGLPENSELVVVYPIFAMSTTANGGRAVPLRGLKERWLDVPNVRIGNWNSGVSEDIIAVDPGYEVY